MSKKNLVRFLFSAGIFTSLLLANPEISSTKPVVSQSQVPQSGISGIPSKETIAENMRNHAIRNWGFPQSGRVVKIESTNLRNMGDIRWIYATIPKWKITIETPNLRLVYITNETGETFVLGKRENLQLPKRLSQTAIAAVQKSAVSYWHPQFESTITPILPSQVLIKKAEPVTWKNTCLELPNSGEICTPKIINGWRITAEGISPPPCIACLPGNFPDVNPPTVTFRVDDTGKQVRADIPESVAVAGFKVTELWGLPTKSGKIVGASATQWTNCDKFRGLPIPCAIIPIKGWLLKIEHQGKRWHIRVDDNGNDGEIMARENITLDNSFDQQLANNVRILAAQHFELTPENILFTQVTAQTFGACLGLPTPVEKCAPDPGQGYRVTVEGKPGEKQVYRVSQISGTRTEANNGLPPRIDKLPNSIAQKVFQDAKSRLNVPLSDLRITSSEMTSECHPTPTDLPNRPCQVLISSGWQIVVTDFKKQLVYRVNSARDIQSVSPK